jgi:uncharacterized protein (TIGR00297 family)
MAGFALLLRWIPWQAAAGLAAAAIVFNIALIPRLGDRLIRPGERERVLRSGVVLYAVAVLVLILIFRHRLEIAAGAWGILAFGDGASTLLGGTLAGPRLPWNPKKSWIGSAAFLLFGSVGGAALMSWVGARYDAPAQGLPIWVLASVAALAGAIVESLPLALDDNLSVPLFCGALLRSLQLLDPRVWTDSAALLRHDFFLGLALTGLFALAARGTGSVSWSGVAGGMLVGTVIATFAGPSGFAVLALFFILGSVATRLGYARKARRGIAQEDRGARGWVHALANGSVPAYLAFLGASTSPELAAMLRVAFVASVATAACDTLGSEAGPLGKGEPLLITRMRRVPAGTPGAVSLLGTGAGAAGALLIGMLAAALGTIPAWTIGVVVAAALLGALLESVLGATLEPMGLVDSETINFVNTAAGGLAALALMRWAGGGTP